MRKKPTYILLLSLASLFFAQNALAVCPICSLAVVTGVGLSRWLGIDDTITGLWIGGLIVSMIIWTKTWLEKKKIHFKGRTLVVIIAYYALVLIPLYYLGIIGHPLNTLCVCGLDKLLAGIITGSLAFWLGASWYSHLKAKNNNHAYFPFQKVVMPILPLLVLSIICYFLIK